MKSIILKTHTNLGTWLKQAWAFVWNDKLLFGSILAAIITSFIHKPKLSYVNFHVIVNVFCIMALVQVYEHLHVLDLFAKRLVTRNSSERSLVRTLVLLVFFTSMFMTNDMTVLTFIPLIIVIAKKCDFSPILPITLVTLAANLGSSLTPFGSPHNIFLVSYYHLGIVEFFDYAWPLLALSLVLLMLFTFFTPKRPIIVKGLPDVKVDVMPLWFVIPITLVVFLTVFSIVPKELTLILVIGMILLYRPWLMKRVDYSLLLIFFCFFIAVGNMAHMPVVANMMHSIGNSAIQTYFAGILACQAISNVPTGILLSGFTQQKHALFLAINIGGMGTMIASMANLIAYKRYKVGYGKDLGKFIGVFTGVNLLFLVIFTIFGLWLI